MSSLELICRAEQHQQSIALLAEGKSYTYQELLVASAQVASGLLADNNDLETARVGFLVPPGFSYAACQWGIWRAGGIAVPLGLQHPLPELAYVVEDAGISTLIAEPAWAEKLAPVAEKYSLPLLLTDCLLAESTSRLPVVSHQRQAMMLYTSGTTSRPKGVVTTHANIQAQTEALIEAWGWTAGDQILHVLGHVLLERYGMTEIGMALSNPLLGTRVAGHVGQPLSNMEVRRVDESGQSLADDMPGEIQVRGPGVFHEYWRKPTATEQAFTQGWFKTGDVAVVEDGSYRILGRNSVDIIKTGGYKVSALEIEEVLREHEQILEVAVVGLPDQQWGERVAACLVLQDDQPLTLKTLRTWSKERLAVYKVPSIMLAVEALPRNVMGKVEKPAIKELFSSVD
jgi:acyl-CoA synthetase (AMP-forming)/AMP-acid ligase II